MGLQSGLCTPMVGHSGGDSVCVQAALLVGGGVDSPRGTALAFHVTGGGSCAW